MCMCGSGSGIICILIIEVENAFYHSLCLNGRRVSIKLNGFHIAFDGILPVALTAVAVAFLVPLPGC